MEPCFHLNTKGHCLICFKPSTQKTLSSTQFWTYVGIDVGKIIHEINPFPTLLTFENAQVTIDLCKTCSGVLSDAWFWISQTTNTTVILEEIELKVVTYLQRVQEALSVANEDKQLIQEYEKVMKGDELATPYISVVEGLRKEIDSNCARCILDLTRDPEADSEADSPTPLILNKRRRKEPPRLREEPNFVVPKITKITSVPEDSEGATGSLNDDELVQEVVEPMAVSSMAEINQYLLNYDETMPICENVREETVEVIDDNLLLIVRHPEMPSISETISTASETPLELPTTSELTLDAASVPQPQQTSPKKNQTVLEKCFPCQQGCNLTYRFDFNLEKHYRRVHLGYKFMCLECLDHFPSESALNEHMTKDHQKLKPPPPRRSRFKRK